MFVEELNRDLYMKYRILIDARESDWRHIEAVELMNEFAEKFAIPFCKRRRFLPAVVKRILNWTSRKRGTIDFDPVQRWRDSYHSLLVSRLSKWAFNRSTDLEAMFRNLTSDNPVRY